MGHGDRQHKPSGQATGGASPVQGPSTGTSDAADVDKTLDERAKAREVKFAGPNDQQRMTPLPSEIDMGLHVIGSGSFTEIGAPMNIGKVGAAVSVSISGDATIAGQPFNRAEPVTAYSAAQFTQFAEHPIRIRFAPDRRGEHTAMLTYKAKFDGGGEEMQSVMLRGRGRDIDQAIGTTPEEAAAQAAEDKVAAASHAEEERLYQADQKIGEPYHQGAMNELDEATADARTSAAALASAQAGGVQKVGLEIASYKKALPPPSLLWALAEIAITIGVAGVAGVVAKALAGRITAGIKGAEATADAVKSSKLMTGLNDSIKEGLKMAGKAALASARPKAGSADVRSDGGGSANPRIDFLDRQDTALTELETNNSELVTERDKYLRPLLRTAPAVAKQGMLALKESFDASFADAKDIQALSTATQWANAVAGGTLGSTTAHAIDSTSSEVTNVDKARPGSYNGAPSAKAGLLDVTLEHWKPYRPVSARIYGVSQEIADRMMNMPLARYPMPIRFVIGKGFEKPAVITRDEAGRIRVDGDLTLIPYVVADGQNGLNEAQVIDGATKLVNETLAKPIWTGVTTDDATGTAP